MLIILSFTILLTGTTRAQEESGTTWQATYWNNISMEGDPALTRVETEIAHDWGSGSPAEEISPNSFSARWIRLLELPAGRYRFTVTVDDGVRLWVDNELIISSWRVQAPRTLDAEIEVAGGDVPVRMEYFEDAGQAVAMLSWEPVQVTAEVWYGEYFPNRNLSGTPALIREVPTISLNWGESSPAPDRLDPDTFSARWQRTLSLEPGTYRFEVTVDDGARLWVDDRLLIDAWLPQPATTYVETINLDGGPVPVRLEYFENGGLAEVNLSWSQLPEAPPPTVTPAPPAPVAPVPVTGGTTIIDDSDTGFISGGRPAADWQIEAIGYDGTLRWSSNSEGLPATYNWGQWRPALGPGRYEVAVYVPDAFATTTQARYWISHADGMSLRIVNQADNNGRWVSLGNFRFAGGDEYVSLTDITFEQGELTRVAYDAVRWTPVGGTSGGGAAISVNPPQVAPGELVVVQGSGFPAGQPIFLRLGPPGSAPRGEYATGRTGPDGEVRLTFTMPSTWPSEVPIAATLGSDSQLGVLLTTDQGSSAVTNLIYQPLP